MTAKYVIIIPDGAADEPIELFDGKTALEAADTPFIDQISIEGRQGLCRTVPPSMPAGSDVAQMSLLGYDPLEFYTGRAPIEAEAMGIKLSETDWVFRCNLVTIADGVMADHMANESSPSAARKIPWLWISTMGDQFPCRWFGIRGFSPPRLNSLRIGSFPVPVLVSIGRTSTRT